MNTSQQTGAGKAVRNHDVKLAMLETLLTDLMNRNFDAKIELTYCTIAQMNSGTKINAAD
jgi:hypothetical protein